MTTWGGRERFASGHCYEEIDERRVVHKRPGPGAIDLGGYDKGLDEGEIPPQAAVDAARRLPAIIFARHCQICVSLPIVR